jgi:hypothetical protein
MACYPPAACGAGPRQRDDIRQQESVSERGWMTGVGPILTFLSCSNRY